jgi:hypothetical protein
MTVFCIMYIGKYRPATCHPGYNSSLHGLLGTVAASSLQPYFFAVSKFFRYHQRQPIAVGELLADARRGLEILPRRLVPADSRMPLPAPIALNIMLAANTLRDNLTCTPVTRPMLERFRACLAICVNYIFFLSCRNRRPLPYR